MVFLKPTILTDSDSSEEVSLEKYNFIRAQKELNEKLDIIDLTKSKD
jgi:type II secretory pathway component GspD/PulD (secretin)